MSHSETTKAAKTDPEQKEDSGFAFCDLVVQTILVLLLCNRLSLVASTDKRKLNRSTRV
jgi:hypothetical protein